MAPRWRLPSMRFRRTGRIVLWAHNEHISNAPAWMGSYLKHKYGEAAYLLGFEFNQGAFTPRTGAIHSAWA